MKATHRLLHLRLLLVIALVLGGVMVGGVPVAAAPTGEVVSNAAPSDATPGIGDPVTVTINIDMTGVTSADNYLGSFTGSMTWNTAVLDYVSNSGSCRVFWVGPVW
jgi:hypothetical protein